MLTYDVLATLWESPATDVEVAGRLMERTGVPCSRTIAEHYLRILRTTGHVRTRSLNGNAAYALTDEGSALLARLAAGAVTSTVTSMERAN